jgi:23S rRNA (cytidine1920-2'-O)/16S rRNA (cytidine1409-2'-O)-methyltransferase
VLAGNVLVLPERRRVSKPGELVSEDAELEVVRAPQFVSRGGVKLANALDHLGLDIAGRRALDVGASTGGFTDCLLQRGVAHVVALDVAYGELDWRVRSDERVTVIERRNARTLCAEELPSRPDLIVVDVSFISLRKVVPAVLNCAASGFDCLALVKPQFELDRARVGKGGVVREPGDRRAALLAVSGCARELRYGVRGFASSKLPGPKGNLETFIWLAEPSRAGIDDLGVAISAVEP